MRTQDLVLKSDSGTRGVSLRRLVQAGVASRYDNAQTTIQTFGYAVEPGTADGLPDLIITNPDDVCAYLKRKRTSARKVIAHAILAGMDEIVALMDGSLSPVDDAPDEVGAALAQVQDPELCAAISGARDAAPAQGSLVAHEGSAHQRRIIAEVEQITEARDEFNDREAARYEQVLAQREARDAQEDEQMGKQGAYTTQIDWRAFVVEHNGQRGVSLRALVEAGLYATYQKASEAAHSSKLQGFQLEVKNPSGGRPAQDFICTDLRQIQKFCVRTRSDVGDQIVDLILDHHDEFQRLLNGDAEAHAQLAAVQPAPQIDAIEAELAALDPLMAMIYRTKRDQAALAATQDQHARALASTEQRLALVEARYTIPADWMSFGEVARACGAFSNSNLPHNQAIGALARHCEVEIRTRLTPTNDEHEAEPAHFMSPESMQVLKKTLRAMARNQGSNTIKIAGNGRTYTVKLI